ncbi:MAG: N-acetylmuramoyl-L-alanine amidase [Synergistaceae bacterium]|nr:N-acetylmuramoyl-L-alanine amidase [Synergistaceae bacterium]
MKSSSKTLLWGALIPIFLLALSISIALAADSYVAGCYVGEKKIGELPVNQVDSVFWIPLRRVAEILDMKISSMGDEVVVSNNNIVVKIVKNSSAARVGNRLVSLSEIPMVISGSLCVGEKSLNVLFQRALGKEPSDFVSFRVDYDPKEFTLSGSKSNRTREPVLYSDSDVRQERTSEILPPVKENTPTKNKTNGNLAEISEIRWNVTQQKIRVVFACAGEKEPVVKKEKDRITVSSAIFPSDVRSQAEDRIQIKEEKSSLIFTGKWQSANVLILVKPKRVLIEFIYDDKTPLAAKPEPAAKDVINTPVNIPVNSDIVVLDPGHGGQDPGAVANGIREKDINLAVALKLESVLKSRGIKVSLTRRTDVYLKLAERTEIANRLNAEVFVSIHANAMPKGKKSARGFEIYLMALPTDNDALELAKFENRELMDGKTNGAASDSKTQLLLSILGDMQQNYKVIESTDLAEVLYKAGNGSGLPMKRVAQAPFFVLRGAAMPAVLLETGFLTDKSEAKLLLQPAYQQKIADAMAVGIIDYLRRR